ncbi:MAG: hypothetical protein EU532_12120 [Promethearchaeota archaeon]|nr:MAG: hypothetical protein EU532_12120 [Candidatus Lokiarchaeota archaeon]
MTNKTQMSLIEVTINKSYKDQLLNTLSNIKNTHIKTKEKKKTDTSEEKDPFITSLKNIRQSLDTLFNKLNINESTFQDLEKISSEDKIEFEVNDLSELVSKSLEEINFYTNRINELDRYIARAQIEADNLQIIKSSYTFLEQFKLSRESISKLTNIGFKVYIMFKKNIDNFNNLFKFSSFPNVHQTDEQFPNAYKLDDRITFYIFYPKSLEEELKEKINLIHAEEVQILKKYLTPGEINFTRIEGEINIINSTLSKYKTEREKLREFNIYKFAAINEVVQNVEEYHWAERQFEEISPKTLSFKFYIPSWKKKQVEQQLLKIFKNEIMIDVFDIPRFHDVKETEKIEPESEKVEGIEKKRAQSPSKNIELEEDIKAETPTIMKNPRFIRPFELITKMYGVPSYSEIDPTPFLAFTFPFIFGLMFGDIGHGMILIISGILGGLIFRKKSIGTFSWIVFYCGIGSALGGFFYGEFFGNETIFGIPLQPILLYVPFLGTVNIYDPLQNIQNVFMFALFIGVVHINLGWFLELINYVRQSKKYLAITNSLMKIILLTGGTFLIFHYGINLRVWLSFPFPILFVIIPGILLILLKPMGKIFRVSYLKRESYGSLMGEGTVETFETALSILSNVASYIRLLALALAHIALMISIQALTGLVQGEGLLFDIFRIFGLVVGNLLVILLEGILVFINTIRLHFYEFFFKFYKGTGTEFFPFYLNNDFSKIRFKVDLDKDLISEEIEKEIEPEKEKLEVDKAVKYIEDNYLQKE